MAFAVDNDDLNGDCFVFGTEGEAEEDIALNHVIFRQGMPSATDATVRQQVNFTANQATTFISDNAYVLYHAGIPFNDALYLAYFRFLAARNGLISPDFTINAWNVRYNDAVRLTVLETTAITEGLTPAHVNVYGDEPGFTAAWGGAAAVVDKAKARKVFTDVVCCIAYMFRVRGHHWRQDLDAKYKTLWARCLHIDGDLQTSWQNLATTGLHAIMPRVLDDFWADCITNSACAGTLIKRFDSAPAGAAGILALKKGLDDINMIFPTIVDRVPESKEAFDDIYEQVSGSRWGASINCRYYGVQRIKYNEADIGALASVVMGVYAQLAPTAELRESMALQRLAKIAPATGGAIGQAALRTTRSEKMMLIE